ncbi:SDR family oxidoreductase [Cryobacterium sp.]|jgi:uncharacterized protein YbjT (DUF2867 family)|uniref:SDR family oxidoreductase n=1 Tax=Cryobacterium sp. TaxID=1926290 RepID=UPI0026150172|nr:SDR family oxidoreductase [Cryobacterium sp.]MCU1446865.1 azoB 1 [Cryobacterium sp.]
MILVAGATGRLGGLITRSLLARGEEVRALVRNLAESPGLTAAGASLTVGDLKDPPSLAEACADAEAVITTANSMARGGSDTVESVDRTGNLNLIDAAAAHGVKRFIFISALGAALESPSPFLRAKATAEQRLHESGMRVTILQPNLYFELLPVAAVGLPALAGRPVTLVGEGRRLHSSVSMADVAGYALAALDHDDAAGQTLVIGGPKPVSWRDVIAAFEDELGREIPVSFVPMGAVVPGLPPMLVDLLTALETYDTPLDMSQLSDRFGIQPTALQTFVHGFVASYRQEGQPAAR